MLCGFALAFGLAGMPAAHAAQLSSIGGFDVYWDNDLRYSAGVRLSSSNATILKYPDSDDGDRDFRAGSLMTNRLDLTSVLDITGDTVGAQLSVNAWYDAVYSARTGNTSPATYNALSVPNTNFTHATQDLDGHAVDLGESFVYGNFSLDDIPVSVRLGRQTLIWGEGLFFADNSIAAGQAPLDYIKSAAAPDGYSRNIYLPVNQLSATLQPMPDLSLTAYYQLEWRLARLPGVGSYFSDTDVKGAGAERAFLAGGQFLLHGRDLHPPQGGQYGLALHKNFDDLDLGLYALRFNAKYPVLQVDPVAPSPSGFAGTFEFTYPAGIDLYGASFSTYLGNSTLAGEMSLRQHMPLVSIQPVSLTFAAPLRDFGYAEGNTLHGLVSAVTALGPNPLWDRADLSAEISANDRLAVTENAAARDPARTRFAASIRLLAQPHYFQVLPNLDLTPSLSVGYNMTGRSSTDYSENTGTADFEIGLAATYLSIWKADLTLTSFAGLPYRQTLTDRDFLMLHLDRAF